MRVFDCKKLTQALEEVAKRLPVLDSVLQSDNSSPDDLIAEQLEIDTLIGPLVGRFEKDHISFREMLAKENGYDYVSAFNKYGIANAIASTEIIGKIRILIDETGKKVAPVEEDGSVSDFSDSLAVVSLQRGFDESYQYYINEKGERINDKNYHKTLPYKFGKALVLESSRSNYYKQIDKDGNVLQEYFLPKDSEFRWSNCGFFGLHEPNRGAWYITPEGRRIPENPNQYFEDNMGNLNNGIARACDRVGTNQSGRKNRAEQQIWYFINQQGERLTEGILSQEFRSVTDFYEDRAYVQTLDDNIYLIDIHGQVLKEIDVAEEKFSLLYRTFTDGVLVLTTRKKDRWVFTAFDLDGNVFLEEFERINSFSGGVAFAFKDGKNYIVDKQGNMTEVSGGYRSCGAFSDGVAIAEIPDPVEKDSSGFAISHKFYIDKQGRRVFL